MPKALCCFDARNNGGNDGGILNNNNLHKKLNLHSTTIETPILWLGHDFKNPIDIWTYLPKCDGILLNAYQLLKTQKVALNKNFVLREILGYYGPMFIDSGGFLFQRNGLCDIKAEEIVELYNNVKPDIGAILDIPINYVKTNVANYRRWKTTLKNTEIMFSNSNNSYLLVQVIHSHSTKAIHYRINQLKKILSNPKMICIGSLVPLLKASHIGSNFNIKQSSESPTYQRWRLISKTIILIRSYYPKSIIHVFGAGSLSTIYMLLLLGVDSIDSVSWRIKAAYGEIQLPGLTSRRIIKGNKSSRVRKILTKQELSILDRCKCPVCGKKSMEKKLKLLFEFKNRAIHNAFVLTSELEEIRKQIEYHKLGKFISDRVKNHKTFKNILNDIIFNELESNSFWRLKQ